MAVPVLLRRTVRDRRRRPAGLRRCWSRRRRWARARTPDRPWSPRDRQDDPSIDIATLHAELREKSLDGADGLEQMAKELLQEDLDAHLAALAEQREEQRAVGARHARARALLDAQPAADGEAAPGDELGRELGRQREAAGAVEVEARDRPGRPRLARAVERRRLAPAREQPEQLLAARAPCAPRGQAGRERDAQQLEERAQLLRRRAVAAEQRELAC